MFFKIVALENFANFTVKHQSRSCRPQVFPAKFAKCLKTLVLQNISSASDSFRSLDCDFI